MSLTKKKEFDLFINNCFPSIESYPTFHLTSTMKKQTEEIVLSHLHLSSMGQVRDRYEGQRYYDKIYRKLITFYCLEKMFNKPVLSPFMIKVNKSVNLNQAHVNGRYIAVTDFMFGELPLVDIMSSYDTLVFCIRDDYKSAYFCGSLPKEELEKKANFIKTDSLAMKNHKTLTNFKILKLF